MLTLSIRGLRKISQTKRRIVKRGGRKYKKNKNEFLNIISANSQGLKLKIPSLKNEVNNQNAAVFIIQETHFRKKGILTLFRGGAKTPSGIFFVKF